jgi:Predicted periplasmic protein
MGEAAMKKILIPVFGTLGAGVLLISGIGNFSHMENPFSSSQAKTAQSTSGQHASSAGHNQSPVPDVRTLGLVAIHYHLFHLNQLASNQIAIWIEDEQGHYVTTVRASSFTAGGGYRMRPEALPDWRKSANWSHAPAKQVNKVRMAEQPAGEHTVYWDSTDANGRAVKPGTYFYKIEGNIYWDNRVIFTGKIRLGKTAGKSAAQVRFIPTGAESKGKLLADVNAEFDPGKPITSVKQEIVTNTQGS